jgi:hypothetical protein
MDSSMSHWQMGVVPPAKCERSRAHWPGPGGANAAVTAPIMVSLAHPGLALSHGVTLGVDRSSRHLRPYTDAVFWLMQVQSGEFVRVFREEEATFGCEERNLVMMEEDLLGQ